MITGARRNAGLCQISYCTYGSIRGTAAQKVYTIHWIEWKSRTDNRNVRMGWIWYVTDNRMWKPKQEKWETYKRKCPGEASIQWWNKLFDVRNRRPYVGLDTDGHKETEPHNVWRDGDHNEITSEDWMYETGLKALERVGTSQNAAPSTCIFSYFLHCIMSVAPLQYALNDTKRKDR